MDALHETLLRIGFAAGPDLGLVLAGGYALGAHDVVDRPSRDIDFATSTALPLPEVATRLVNAYRAVGYEASVVEATPRMARLIVFTPDGECEVDLLKEAIGPPAQLTIGPVLAFDDAVGLKVRALHDRAAHRDYIDIYGASSRNGARELEALGARHTPNFTLDALADRLGGIRDLDDETFAAYGLSDADIDTLRDWATEWETDIRSRLLAGHSDPPTPPGDEWDAYLEE